MMKKSLQLLICLLIAVSAISQQSYPRLISIKNDTLVAFRPEQVTKMNVIITKYEECQELKRSVNEENRLLIEKNGVLEWQRDNLLEQNKVCEEISKEKEKQTDILLSENKKKDKRIKYLKKSRPLFTLGGAVIGSAITYGIILLLK